MNEERNIAACLDSIVGWADDIVVVDSGSTDGTISLCTERGIQPVFHAYTDHRSQIQWAMTSVPWRHDWFLLLDADSVVTPELKEQIDAMVQSDDETLHGYYTAHQRYFRNRPVRGVTNRRLLLIRRSRVRVDESELVDFRFVVGGPTGMLAGAIIESNQNELEIDFWIDKHQKFARRTAIEQVLREENVLGWSRELRPHPFGTLDERIIWLKNIWYDLPLYVRPGLLFLYRYVVRGGFLDGWNGFVFHAFQAFWFRLLVDIHVDEYRVKLRQRALSLDDLLRLAGRNPADRAAGEAL